MSELTDRKKAPVVTEQPGGAAALGAEIQPSPKPVHLWAALGGVILAFQLYVWGRWVTGPYFERVPQGPSDPPTLMKAALLAETAVQIVLFPTCVYLFIIRPWMRERRITLDGILLVCCGLLFFQDPLLNYLNTWSTYNTWLFNRGSWVEQIPGWLSYGEPGRMGAEPLLINIPGYATGLLLCTILGCWVLRRIKARWPNISNFRLICAAAVYAFFFDFVMEGLILMPMGFYTYPGAIKALSINADTYYQWPIYEGVTWGAVQAGLCSLRYFTDDRGQTFAERGLEHVKGGFAKTQFIRFLAIFAVCSSFFFFFYNLPAQWFGMHAESWPEDVMKRSYLLGGICGDGTDMPCPDPALPIPVNGSGYVNTDGKLVLPPGVSLPKTVPTEGPRP